MSQNQRNTAMSFAAAGVLAALLAAPADTEAAIGYWRFEGTDNAWLQDSSGNGHHLTVETGAGTQITLPDTGAGAAFPSVIPQTGQANQSAMQRTSTSQLELATPDTSAFSIDKKFTIEAYFNASSVSSSYAVIAGQFHSSGVNKRSWQLALNNSGNVELMLSANGSTTNRSVTSTATFANNIDYYVAFTVDLDNKIDFYYQQLSGTPGDLIHAQTFDSPVSSVFNPDLHFHIGSIGHGAFAFTGVIDEVRLSGDKLASGELLAAPVPEPASIGIIAVAGIGLLARRHRKA